MINVYLFSVKLGAMRGVKDTGSTCCSCSEYSAHDMSSIRQGLYGEFIGLKLDL